MRQFLEGPDADLEWVVCNDGTVIEVRYALSHPPARQASAILTGSLVLFADSDHMR
jgi:hypothetical protein